MLLSKLLQPTEIAIDQILPNPHQPRKKFNNSSLEELANSIREYGVLQPVIVNRMAHGSYLLIAGERRYRAAQLAGKTKIPAIIKNVNDKDTAIIALTENLQRENLNYFEEALAYSTLMREHQITQVELSRLIGKQQSTISNKVRLLSLDKVSRDLLLEHDLTERHARALLSIENEDIRHDIIDTIIKQELSINQTEKLISSLKEAKIKNSSRSKYIDYKIYLNTLKQAFHSIKQVSPEAKYSQTEEDQFVVIHISIPKTTPLANQKTG